MLSDYDYKNYDHIVNDPRADWYAAILLKYLSRLPMGELEWWKTQYPEECELVLSRNISSKEYITLIHLDWKADPGNRRKIAAVLRGIADTIDPETA